MEDLPAATLRGEGQSTEVERATAHAIEAIEGDICRISEAAVLTRVDRLLGSADFDPRNRVDGP